jgi:hypothetical protein
MLIHATITISGDAIMRAACEPRMRRLLSGHYLKNEVTEHHGREALCYDLKVEGGIPFPLFCQASQEFPELKFEASWVNIGAGESGSATIVNGSVTEQASSRLAAGVADDYPVYVEAGPDGRLRLALVVVRATREEWRGYAVTAERDALICVRRVPGSDEVELLVTEGAPEWSAAWRGTLPDRLSCVSLEAPVAIDATAFSELDALARGFAGRWIWFARGEDAEVAVEADRYQRYGYPVAEANIRASRLHRMRADAGEGAPLVHSTLGEDERWIKEFLLSTWAKEPVNRDS